MTGYTAIPVMALLCYMILLVAFLASKKTKLINSFIVLLFVFLFWTLGSLCMRMQIYPSTGFWFAVSIDALWLVCYSFYGFVSEYTGIRNHLMHNLWLIGSVATIIINHVTGGLFIKAPTAVMQGEKIFFTYDIGSAIAIPLAFNALIIISIIAILIKYDKKNISMNSQIFPVQLGICTIFLGNVLASFPMFSKFPIDILAGAVNALLIFYAMYNRRLFRLTLLVSKGTIYIVSAVLSIILFYYLTNAFQGLLFSDGGVIRSETVLTVSVSYALAVLIIAYIIKKFVDKVFINKEIAQADLLREFSLSISKTLKIDEILTLLIRVIEKTVHVEKAYVCLLDFAGETYKVVQSSSQLDEKKLTLKKDNPLVALLEREKSCILMEELRRSFAYKSMWETEKRQLDDLKIQAILPLLDDDTLVGIVLLSKKEKNASYSISDVDYLQSLASVSSIAVKNSRLYEKVYLEAKTDDLTGLLNRNYFYEALNEEYNKNPENELSLMLISLDDFKLYNQLYGTREGDLAIKNAANIISGTVGERGIVARYEGKTFAVILPGCDTMSAITLSNIIRMQIKEMNARFYDYAIKTLTCSCGVCTIPMGASDIRQLENNADLALSHAKKSGKNCTRSYTEGPLKKTDVGRHIEGVGDYKPDVYEEYASTIFALTAAIDAKDHYTFSHSQKVCYYATELAKAYGMDDDCVQITKEAALLHDIGKIGVPEHILKKPGKLSDEEYRIMKTHVEQSIAIIKHLPSLDYVIPVVIGHHERFDGRGYPRGIKGEEIPLLARVLCIADSFDAMISKRAYKDPYPIDYAIEQLRRGRGTQFDPNLTDLFIELIEIGKIEVKQEIAS